MVSPSRWKDNARGIDINRNFDSITWKQKSKEDYPFSEVESQFMKRIFDKYYRGIYIDIHSRGKNIYYYRKSMNDSYNYRQKIIAKDISSFTKYRLSDEQEEINVGDSGGNTVHYYSEKYNCPALTIETVKEDETFPLDYKNVDKIYEEISPLVMSNSVYPILTPGKALPHRSVQIIADITIMWGRVNGVGGGVVVFNLLVFISFDDFIISSIPKRLSRRNCEQNFRFCSAIKIMIKS